MAVRGSAAAASRQALARVRRRSRRGRSRRSSARRPAGRRGSGARARTPRSCDQLDRGVAADRLRDQAGQRRPLQLEPVAAGEEADEIRGGVDGRAVDELHRGPSYGRGVPACPARAPLAGGGTRSRRALARCHHERAADPGAVCLGHRDAQGPAVPVRRHTGRIDGRVADGRDVSLADLAAARVDDHLAGEMLPLSSPTSWTRNAAVPSWVWPRTWNAWPRRPHLTAERQRVDVVDPTQPAPARRRAAAATALPGPALAPAVVRNRPRRPGRSTRAGAARRA